MYRDPSGPVRSLWSGSAWAFWRAESGAAALASGSRLGGSQAGIRLARRLTGSLSAYTRASAAWDRPYGEELAVGVAVATDGRIPLSLGLERRIAVGKSARNALAVIGTMGLNPTPVAGAWHVDGYGQAGIVGAHHKDPFVDGRITLGRPMMPDLMLGLSVSGGAQKHSSRIDLSPRLDWRISSLPINPHLSLEWRHRVGGNAAPGSGPALTLSAGF